MSNYDQKQVLYIVDLLPRIQIDISPYGRLIARGGAHRVAVEGLSWFRFVLITSHPLICGHALLIGVTPV